ncbi:hypothetical protein BDL97_02G043900 [Sphagnum fallax]|nr:hypothetical protein BDL97_02G043900 [Sphagnum fallax]KAH8969644.1 hypothetical protein BDL97_02G043900 [Sphagnum fallax]KAH8969645.1 hypothetical protein BDL97_02G043900 [Sphagnum fallax]
MGSSSCCLLLLHRHPFSPPVSHHHHPHHYHHHPNSFPIAAATTNKLSSLLTSSSSAGTSSSSASTGRQKVQGRRELLGGLIVSVAIQGSSCAFLAGCRQATAAEEQQEQDEHLLPEVGLIEGRLRGCKGSAPCVSTSAFQSPSRFMPPWVYLGNLDEAYNALKKALVQMGAKIVTDDGSRYIYAFLPSGNSRVDDVDDLEFLFVGNVVCYRSVSRVTIPDPPFCWWPGCINGPRNRGRLEHLRDELGWVPLETDEDKHWVPLLLH